MPPQRPRATLPVLFSVVVVDLIGFGIVLPVLPFYAREYGASGLALGALLTSYAVMQFVFAPIWGGLSDRIGRRPVMLMTIAGTAGSLLLLGLADSLLALFVARIGAGAFAANVSVATAYVGDVTEPAERTRWMGMIGASFAVGFLVGPALGGLLSPVTTEAGLRFTLLGPGPEELLSPFGYGLPMLGAAALAGVNLLYALVVLREPPAHSQREGVGTRRSDVLRDPLVRRVCGIYLLFSLAVTQLEAVFALLMMDRFGYDARSVAAILILMAVVMGTIQGGAIRPLAARFGERTLLVAGLVGMGASFALVPYAPSVGLLLVPLVVASAARGIAHPPLLALVSVAASPESRGAVMGTFQSTASLARIGGPIVAGALYDLSIAAPFLLASLLVLAATPLSRPLPAAVGEPIEPVPVGD